MIADTIDKNDFYQSKYDFYKKFTFWVVIFSCLASTTYFISDCQLFGRFAEETLIARMNILIPMLIYIIIYRRNGSYKIMVPLAYIILHMIMWNTIWAIYYLPDRTHASEGFIIMHLMFFAMGFCAPFAYSTVAHTLVIFNILISNMFNHYANLDIMLSLGIPCVVAICAVSYFMQKLYRSHYRVTKRLEYNSYYDSLTEVYNRNILSKLTTGIKFSEFLGDSVCVMVFDIDFFKKVNDTYGHVKGDIVLKHVAGTVSKNLSQKNYMIRWGGEEFVIVMPDKSIEKAYEFADVLRKKVEFSENGVCPITISAGLACYDGKDYKSAIDYADKALYRAKELGRNRVEIWE